MKDEEFFAKLLATFRVEADEHLKTLSNSLIALEGHLPPDENKQTIETIFREAHSLKGAARAVGHQTIEQICQIFENVLAAWKQGQLQPSTELFDTLHATLDVLSAALETSPDKETVSSIIQRLEQHTATLTQSCPGLASSPQTLEVKETEKVSRLPEQLPTKPGQLESKQNVSNKEIVQDKWIRTSLSKMNQIFQETEEMLMVKLLSQKQVVDLKDLLIEQRNQEKDIRRLLSDTQILRRYLPDKKETKLHIEAIQKMFAFLDRQQLNIKASKQKLNQLIKISEQNSHFVESIVDTLLEDMKKVLMQPMNTLFETLPSMIRNIARELGKEIHVEFEGQDIEVDRRILEEIKDPVIHLVRNAIDHGIELPEERQKLGKSTFGNIKIAAAETSGNHVTLSIIDDGRGINIEKFKNLVIEKGILSSKEALEIKDEEAMKLAFQLGISTSQKVTEFSGRGLGVGIVVDKVEKLGGQVIIESKPNKGTTFKLILPLTLATFRGIHLTVAGHDFIMPTHHVKRVLRIKGEEIKMMTNLETIVIDNQSFSYIHLADLLGLAKPVSKRQTFQFVVLVSAVKKTIAFGIDAIHSEQEVLVKGLGKQCKHIKNIMAATVMESGNVVPILNPIDLIHSSTKISVSQTSIEVKQEQAPKKEVLLVEDSATTRLFLKSILESVGYKVKAAVDGVEALEVLQRQKVDLILTDIQMPRMDGFTLIEHIKAVASLKDLPIIICTSQGSQQDRERGMDLGANAYLDKSSFTQKELLQLLKNLL